MKTKSPFLKSLEAYMRVRNYSERTIDAYLYWCKYFIVFSGKKHPRDLDSAEIERFLSYLANDRRVAPGTQKVALNAIVFLKSKYLSQSIRPLEHFRKASRQRKLPVVLTTNEVRSVLAQLSGVHYLMAALLYGSGLRRIELVRLRVRDIDPDYRQIRVINGKGGKHRLVTLAEELLPLLNGQVAQVELYLQQDRLNAHYAGVWMPDALERKYPNAPLSLNWQYLFPASRLSVDPSSGLIRRHHHDENNVNKKVRWAARQAGLHKEVTCHTLRHSFATHLLQSQSSSAFAEPIHHSPHPSTIDPADPVYIPAILSSTQHQRNFPYGCLLSVYIPLKITRPVRRRVGRGNAPGLGRTRVTLLHHIRRHPHPLPDRG